MILFLIGVFLNETWISQDEDDDEGEPKGKKSKMSNNAKGKAASPKKNAKKWTAYLPECRPYHQSTVT